MDRNVKFLNVIKFAGAFMAFLIGAGFATGQEVFQYFAAYGMSGLIVGIATFVGLGYAGSDFIAVGRQIKFENTNDIYRYYCGNIVGGFYDFFSTLFIYMSYVVMLSGAGATVAEYYHYPPIYGGILMFVLSVGTVLLGLSKIVDIIGTIGPAIVILALGVGIGSLALDSANLQEGLKFLAQPENAARITKVGNSWYTSAWSYVGFCMLWLAAFCASMGQQANSVREGVTGTMLGALGFAAGAVVLMLGFIAHMADVAFVDIPSLIIAAKIYKPLASVFSIVILAGIYTTSVPLLWSVSARFAAEKSTRYYALTVICALAALGIAFSIPFKQVVNVIYGINGYVGGILLLFMLAKRFGISKLGMK